MERECEKIEAFFNRKFLEITESAVALQKAISSGSLRAVLDSKVLSGSDINLGEASTEGGLNDYLQLHELNAILIERLEECRLRIRKLLNYASLNVEGFRKALKKFDKNSKRGSSPLMDTVLAKVHRCNFAQREPLQQLDIKIEFEIKMLLKGLASPDLNGHQTLNEINNIWDEIYAIQVKAILEKDDAEALLATAQSLRSRNDALLFPKNQYIKSGNLLKREQEIFINALLNGICQHSSFKCLTLLLKHVDDLSQIEKKMNVSWIRKALEAPRIDKDTQKVVELLIQGRSSLSITDHQGHGLVHLAVLHKKQQCLKSLLSHGVKYCIFDNDGCSPLYFAIRESFVEGTEILLDTYSEDKLSIKLLCDYSLDPVLLASKIGHVEILELLLKRGFNCNFQDDDGESPLYHCAKRGHLACLELLLRSGADPEKAENYEGWTPLFVAASLGCVACVETLIGHGAKKDKKDLNGWFAFEHAMLRGYRPLALTLKPDINDKNDANMCWENFGKIVYENEPEYGHSFLETKTQLRISLGHLHGGRSSRPAVEILDRPVMGVITNLQLRIYASNQLLGDSILLDLPLKERFEALKFTLKDGNECFLSHWDTICFELSEKIHDGSIEIIGQNSLMLSLVVDWQGNPLFPGSQQFAIPILDQKSLKPAAIVSFEVLIAKPFLHEKIMERNKIYWKSVSTKVIGHRGLGANSGLSYPQVGENTVLSFVMAASLGAEYVEFGRLFYRKSLHA